MAIQRRQFHTPAQGSSSRMLTLDTLLPAEPRAAARVSYVLDWLCAHPYADGQLRWSAFAKTQLTATHFALDAAELTRGSAWLSAPLVTASALLTQQLPSIRVSCGQGRVAGIGPASGAQLYVDGGYAFDWISSLFFWLSRWEEQVIPQTDFAPPRAEDCWLVQHKLEREPQADRLAAGVLSSFGVSCKIERSCVALTYDLDHIRAFQMSYSWLRYGDWLRRLGGGVSMIPRAARQQVATLLGTANDPFDNAEQALRADGQTLYLLLGRHVGFDGRGDKTDLRLAEWIDRARGFGYRIGLHPSYTTASHPERLAAEVERFTRLIGEPPVISRQHFLRWDWRSTPQALLAAGITEDSSLGFRDRLGFRCGTSFPYQLYDFGAEAASALVERPTAGMDGSWMEDNQYNNEACAADWEDFVGANQIGSELTMIMHNSTYDLANALSIDLDLWHRTANKYPAKRA